MNGTGQNERNDKDKIFRNTTDRLKNAALCLEKDMYGKTESAFVTSCPETIAKMRVSEHVPLYS